MSTVLRMSLVALLMAILAVAAILSFVSLGPLHPAPWVLVAVVIAIPLISGYLERHQFVVWKDEYSVGIETIDDDHRKLLDLINRLQTAVHYNNGESFEREAMKELIDYTKYHFAREEQFMEECDYADFASHKREHARMVEDLNEMLADYEGSRPVVIEKVADFLQDWLIRHIKVSDQKYAPCLREKGMEGMA